MPNYPRNYYGNRNGRSGYDYHRHRDVRPHSAPEPPPPLPPHHTDTIHGDFPPTETTTLPPKPKLQLDNDTLILLGLAYLVYKDGNHKDNLRLLIALGYILL